MAKKKTKEPTIKEQFYQSIANAQVQQAMQNNSMAQFQSEYDNWKNNNAAVNTDGYKAFQDEYNNWASSQPKTQTVSTQSSAPKKQYNEVKFKTADERKAYNEKTTIQKPGSYDESKSYANTFGKMRAEGKAIGDSVQQIPQLNDYVQQLKNQEYK